MLHLGNIWVCGNFTKVEKSLGVFTVFSTCPGIYAAWSADHPRWTAGAWSRWRGRAADAACIPSPRARAPISIRAAAQCAGSRLEGVRARKRAVRVVVGWIVMRRRCRSRMGAKKKNQVDETPSRVISTPSPALSLPALVYYRVWPVASLFAPISRSGSCWPSRFLAVSSFSCSSSCWSPRSLRWKSITSLQTFNSSRAWRSWIVLHVGRMSVI